MPSGHRPIQALWLCIVRRENASLMVSLGNSEVYLSLKRGTNNNGRYWKQNSWG